MEKRAKKFSVKSMIGDLLEAGSDMDSVFDTLENVHELGYIADDVWGDFYKKCRTWEYNGLIDGIQDTANGKVIKFY